MEAYDLLCRLSELGITLGSCESLTGGLFGATICSIPGASNVYKGGLITYTPETKNALAGVSFSTIEENGVVSAQVAAEMASGARGKLGVDLCLSCTGNAGPTAQEGGEPVGSVYIAASYGGQVWTAPLSLSGSRDQIRKTTVQAMINLAASLFPKEGIKQETAEIPAESDK